MAKILIVDDSSVMRSLLAEFLTDAGHEVETSDNGQDGLQKALTGQFDVCICDVHMPKLSGYELLRQVLSKRPDLEVVFTDSMPDQVTEMILEAGNYYCLRKPFELTHLKDILDKVLKTVKSS